MKKFLKKRWIMALAVLLVVAMASYWYYAQKQASNASRVGAGYTLSKVTKGDIEILVDANGSIAPGDSATVKAKVDGTVETVLVAEGQTVVKGDTLLLLDGQTGSDEIQLAQINLDIENRNLADLIKDQGKLKIIAPVAGVIGSVTAEEGDEVSSNAILASITDKSQMEVTCALNKSQIALVKKGNPATILLPDMMQSVSGKVAKVGSSGTAASSGAVLYDVQVLVTNPGGLYEGMATQTTIQTSQGAVASAGETSLKYHVDDSVVIKVGGTLTHLYVSAGDLVKKGQLLAVIESTDLETQIIKQRLTVQQKSLQLQQTVADTAGNNVTAPISGTVMSVEVTEGDDLSPSTTVATISDYNTLQVVVPVDELDIAKIILGQEATVTGDAVADKKLKAVVTDIAEEGVTASGVSTFDVTLTMVDKEGLMAGMTVDASIFIQSKKNVLLIPIDALKQSSEKSFVMVAQNGSTDPATAKRTEIEIGLSTTDNIEVIQGLAEGDQILIAVSTSTSGSNTNAMMPMGGGGPPDGGGGGKPSGN